MQHRPHLWTYNSRTFMGEKTYTDGDSPKFEILVGKNALMWEMNTTQKGDIHIGRHPELDEDAPGSDS